MNDIIVSICTLTYNHEPYIRQCLNGFMMQKCDFKFEVLIHDDASTDGTQAVIEEYEREYPNIVKPIYQTTNQYSNGNKSPSATFNFPRAQGKYIAMCEGDDYWIDPFKLQKQVDYLEANPGVNICFAYSNKVDVEGNIIEPLDNMEEIKYTQYDFLTGRKYQTRTCTVMFKRELAGRLGSQRISNGDTWLKINATHKTRGVVLPFVAGCYRIHGGGVWSSIASVRQHEISYNDWKVKFIYALKNNFSAVGITFVKMIKSWIKWKLLSIRQ